MDTPPRWILRNVARRPIELHDAGEVQIIPPDGSIEVEAIGAQCAALIGRGLLTQQEAPPPSDEDESEAEPAPAKPRKRAASKRGESKKDSPRPGVTVVEEDQATGLRKGEGE